MSVADQLREMGFDGTLVERAVKETGGESIETAMEWILANQGQPAAPALATPQTTQSAPSSASAPAAATTATTSESSAQDDDQMPDTQKTVAGQVARSMKCDDCGKLFPNEDALVWHASKTGHSNFSESNEEIKPKSPEEVKAARDALEARIKENRKIREEKERQEELERERDRRNQGREIVGLRQKFKEDEILREAEARKREKLEDAAARKKILEQIERDREERRKRQQGGADQSEAPKPKPAPTQPVAAAPPKNYDETRLQIRLTNGQALTQTFKTSEVLAAVRCYVLTNRTDGEVPFQIMTSFPKKVFTEEDMTRSLKDLNLVPSAVLILSKTAAAPTAQ